MESQRIDGERGGSLSKLPQANRPDAAGAGRTTTTTTRQHQHVKVKHIVTTEVSTDEASFKDVVQSLTGKDSGAARAEVLAGAVGGSASRSNDALLAGGAAAGVAYNDTVPGVLPSPDEEGMKWFWRGA